MAEVVHLNVREHELVLEAVLRSLEIIEKLTVAFGSLGGWPQLEDHLRSAVKVLESTKKEFSSALVHS